MKKNKYYLIIIAILSLYVAKIFFFREGAIVENDVDFHYSRALSTVHALIDRQIIPQLDPTPNYGTGYSWNLFYGPLPTYFIALFFLLTHSISISINLIMILSVLAIGFIMYSYINYTTKSSEASLVGAILIITSTSVLNSLYQYLGYGPLFAIFFSIMALYGIQILLQEDNYKIYYGVILTAIGGAGTVQSHTLTCLVLVFYIFLYIFFNIKIVLKRLRYFLLSGLLSVGFSGIFLFPLIEVKNYQVYNLFNKKFTGIYMWKNPGVLNHGRPPLFSIFKNMPSVTAFPSVLFWISLTVVILIFIFDKKSSLKKIVLFFFVAGLSSMILASNAIDWAKMPEFLWTIQSPTRIMIYGSGVLFSIAIAVGISILFSHLVNTKIITIIMVFISMIGIFLSIYSINSPNNRFKGQTVNLETLPKDTSIAYAGNGGRGGLYLNYAVGEFFPTAVATQEKSLEEIIKENHQNVFFVNSDYIIPALKQRAFEGVKFLNSNDIISEEITKPNTSYYSVNITRSNKIRFLEFPRVAYPGYKARLISNNKILSLKTKASPNGYVQVEIPKGYSGKLEIHYGISKATFIGIVLFVMSIVVIIVLLLRAEKIKKKEDHCEKTVNHRSSLQRRRNT